MYERGLGLVVSGSTAAPVTELGAAAVRHPDARLVVAPGPSEQTRRLAHRSQQHDALRRVGGATRTFTGLRRARHCGDRATAPAWRSGLARRRPVVTSFVPRPSLAEAEEARARRAQRSGVGDSSQIPLSTAGATRREASRFLLQAVDGTTFQRHHGKARHQESRLRHSGATPKNRGHTD